MTSTIRIAARVLLVGAAAQVPLGVLTADEPARQPMPMNDAMRLHYQGQVTEVTKDSITILWPGDKKPKKFLASEILAAGKFPTKDPPRSDGFASHTLSPSYRYRLTDVEVGDQVYIRLARVDGKDICYCISISKRPGGRVPPLPEGAENLIAPSGRKLIAYHEYMNALWDLEDKGIPFPEKFGNQRRWPVAPMPRAVGGAGTQISQ